MALLDTLNAIRNRKKQVQPTDISGELAGQAREAQVGARQSTGPAASNLGAQRQQAIGQTQEQLQQVGANIEADKIQQQAGQQEQALGTQRAQQQQQFTEAMAGLGAQAQIGAEKRQTQAGMAEDKLASQGRMSLEQISNGYTQAMDKLAAEAGIQRDDMFTKFQNSNKELADRQDAAELEQVAFLYAMNDKAYVDQINAVAKQRGLENDIKFRQEALDISLGSELASVLANSKLNVELATNDSELAKELAKMDLNTALEIARAAAKQQSTQSIITGVGQLATAGATAFGPSSGSKGTT